MKSWEAFLAWVDLCPKTITHIVTDPQGNTVETLAFRSIGESENEAKQKLMTGVTQTILAGGLVYVRVMPEVEPERTRDGTLTGCYIGYARLAIFPKQEGDA